MKDHEGDYLAFIHVSRAWYSAQLRNERYVDEVMFGYYSPDGGTSGEMCMRWYNLNEAEPTPRLEVFCDAWHALSQMGGLLDFLASVDEVNISPEAFCRALVSLGFKDQTPVDEKRRATLEENLRKLYEAEVARMNREGSN